MRHHNKIKKFGREKNQRGALMRSLAESLLIHERVRTTETKAKALRPLVERIISVSRTDSPTSRRLVLKRLKSRLSLRRLYKDIAPRYASRTGGYTRVVKLGSRLSDGARMAIIELV